MFDEVTGKWRIPTVTKFAKVRRYLSRRAKDEDEVKTVAVTLPFISICSCCPEST
jgi:hypothetical protein